MLNKIKEKEIVDSFQAFFVEGAEFTKNEEYPIIRYDMVPKEPPLKIMPFSKAINYRGDLSKTVIYFFCPDATFERVRKHPKRYLNFFKRTAGIIGFDFSVHSDMPIVKQKSQMNDNLSLSYYYGNNNIGLYPSARCGSQDLEEEYLSAFPKHTIISLGVHGFIKKKYQKQEWRYWIRTIIEFLEPSGLLVIGKLDSDIVKEFSDKTTFYLFDSFIDERNTEVGKHGK